MLGIFKEYMGLFGLPCSESDELTDYMRFLEKGDDVVEDIIQKLEFSIVINDLPDPSLRFGYFKANPETVEKEIGRYVSDGRLAETVGILKRNCREFATGMEWKSRDCHRTKLYSLKLEGIPDEELNRTVIAPLNMTLYGTAEEHVPKHKISIIGIDWMDSKPSLKIYERGKNLDFQSLEKHMGVTSLGAVVGPEYLDDCWFLTRYGCNRSKSIFFSFNQAPEQEVYRLVKKRLPDKYGHFSGFMDRVGKIGDLTYTFFGISDRGKHAIYFGLE